MPRFVARPVVVEAHQYLGNVVAMPIDFRDAVRRYAHDGSVDIMSSDGLRCCRHGDWIVRGPTGEFSIQRVATFEKMFEPHHPPPPVVEAPTKRANRKETV